MDDLPHYISFFYRSCQKKHPNVKNPKAQAAYDALCSAMIAWGDHTDRPAPLETALEALNCPAEHVREIAAIAVRLIATKSDKPANIFRHTLDRANARGRLWIAISLRRIVSVLNEDEKIEFMRRLILDRSAIVREKASSACIYTPHAHAILPTLYEALAIDKEANNPYWSTRHAIGLIEHGHYFSQNPLDPDRMLMAVVFNTGCGDEIEILSHDIHKDDLEKLGEARVSEELREWCQSNYRKEFDWMSR